jgi:hypothetical protein
LNQLAFQFAVPPASRKPLLPPSRLDKVGRHWGLRFTRYFKKPFRVRFTDNSSTMISSRVHSGVVELRLHHMFIKAQDGILAALADYLLDRRKGQRRLDGFIERNRDRVGNRNPNNPGESRGKRFDLTAIRDTLNRAYFSVPVEVPVVWGASGRRKRRRSIRLGSYCYEDHIIRIHPALDQDFVPAYVVAGVVYHEMLHHALGVRRRNGRRLVHTREFREREARFTHHQEAESWERENLGRLLRRRRPRQDRRRT